VFVLGENVYNPQGCVVQEGPFKGNGGFPVTWDGGSLFDFSGLAREVDRRKKANPNLKIILQVALDGSKNWLSKNSGNQTNADLRARGIPDYLDPQWQESAAFALRTLVEAVENSIYADTIVGYELFNGYSLDANPEHSLDAPAALKEFQSFLERRYDYDVEKLQASWNSPSVSFETARPLLIPPIIDVEAISDPTLKQAAKQSNAQRREAFKTVLAKAHEIAPLFAPDNYAELADTNAFRSYYDAKIIEHFAQSIKSASNRSPKPLVGVRTGEILVSPWKNIIGGTPVHRNFDFYKSENIDFFEVWDQYGDARKTSWLAGGVAPLMPDEGLRLLGKKYVFQNDYRVGGANAGDKNYGFGYDVSLGDSIKKQKRVFAAALTSGRSPYLWEMSYDYGQKDLLALWDQQQEILRKSKNISQESAAQVAIVVDPELQKYLSLGFELDPSGSGRVDLPTKNAWIDQPGFLNHMINIPINAWARAGAPTDMIFLDQFETTPKAYKVYIFFHTFALSDRRIAAIHDKLKAQEATGVFVYAAGMMDENGSVNTSALGSRISALTQMSVEGSTWQRFAQLSPSSDLQNYWQAKFGYRITDLRRWETPTGRTWESGWPVVHNLFPSFVVKTLNPGDVPLATYRNSSEVAIARKSLANGASIVYSATPHIPTTLLREILREAGVSIFAEGEDLTFVNKSFVGVTADDRSTSVALNLPTASALYDVFEDKELPFAAKHQIDLSPNSTRLFFRGTKAEWLSIPTQ
jgi:hypothetical protein